jgi:hypothetical protein
MADFVAVLRKTLDGLTDPSPEMREKVYRKARATIEAKLGAIRPAPPQSVIDRQKKALEQAIAEVEAGYAVDLDIDDAAFEDMLAEEVEAEAAPARVRRPEPAPERSRRPDPVLDAEPAPRTGQRREPVFDDFDEADEREVHHAADDWDRDAEDFEAPRRPARPTKDRPRRGFGSMLMSLLVLLVLAGAGYAAWQNRALLMEIAGMGEQAAGPSTAGADADREPEAAETAGTDVASRSVGDGVGAGGDESPEKFTQRLTDDGREVDPGPAGGEPRIGEGTSVAAASPPAGGGTAPSGAVAPPGESALPVGQKAIFYEERTNSMQGSAEPGQVVWSLVEESPGTGLPPEPAIRAEATIPGKDIQFRMTIRRNADNSLPASHIIEMIFLVPDNFEGGAIDNVLRVAFKDSEQSPGNPLLGIPAKISDGFFLLALSDSKAEIDANSTMMRRLDWLDIPIIYRSGRRALITLEKGIPGAKVFEDALKAWAPESSG